MQADNIEFLWNSAVTEFTADDRVTGAKITNLKTGDVTGIDCDGVFISIGRKPATDFVRGKLLLDVDGYIIADETTRTDIPGVYAAGDVRTKALRQVVTAVSDGAVAVHFAEKYLAEY